MSTIRADTPGRLRGCVQPPCDGQVMTTTAVQRWCATCGSDVTFEQPDCIDEHEGDCPEWVCIRCDEACLVGFGARPADAVGAA